MSPFEILALGGVVAVLIAVAHILIHGPAIGNTLVAAVLAGGFAGFTGVTIFYDGVVEVCTNHTTNLWGVQVWWDLLFSVGVALFLIAPRARKVGMNVPLWALFVVATASIGLLAMCAVLFHRERAATAKVAGDTAPTPTTAPAATEQASAPAIAPASA